MLGRPLRDVKFATWLKWSASEARFRTPTLTDVKDPTAPMSDESIADCFKPQMILMFRRPATVVCSFMRRGWDVPLARFVEMMRPFGFWSDEQLPKRRSRRDFLDPDRMLESAKKTRVKDVRGRKWR